MTAPSEDSNQPGHLPSLIRVFAVCTKKAWVLRYPLSTQRRLIRLGGCPADLSLCCTHSHFVDLSSDGSNMFEHWIVHQAKTQISLGIRPVWSESSLCTQWVAKDPSFLHADSEDSDQTLPFSWFCHELAHIIRAHYNSQLHKLWDLKISSKG